VSGQQLAAIKTVLGVAYGQNKIDAVRSALTGGLVTSLVTHSSLARLLTEPDTQPAQSAAADAAHP
jgi:DNA-binding transcriptional regulator LsrR (DeoR family)